MTVSRHSARASGSARQCGTRAVKSVLYAARTTLPLALLLAVIATVGSAQEEPTTPAQEFETLRAEFDRVPRIPGPLTDAERLEYVGRVYRHRHAFAPRFVELAEKHPGDPVALDALMQAVWQVNTIPWPVELVGEDTARSRAFELILRDHVRSDRVGPLCWRVSFGFCQEYEAFLRAVLSENPHREVQAVACFSLGQFLNNRRNRIALCEEQPEVAREFAALFGAEYLTDLQGQDGTGTVEEIETFLARAAEDYGDVTLPAGDTVARRANAALFEIRHLGVGQEAPDIEGEDQHGEPLRLSNYRGKVVMLDFWSHV